MLRFFRFKNKGSNMKKPIVYQWCETARRYVSPAPAAPKKPEPERKPDKPAGK